MKIFGTDKHAECTVVTKERSMHLDSKIDVSIYDIVRIENGEIVEKLIGDGKELYDENMAMLLLKIKAKDYVQSRKSNDPTFNKIIKRITPRLADVAAKASRAFISGAPMVVRFHNDGDGATGGIAIYRALSRLVELGLCDQRQVSWQMNRSVFYTLDAFYLDKMVFESRSSAERPLLFITDFGTATESNSAIASASPICDIVWIDHHVIPSGFEPWKGTIYVNPFNMDGDSKLSAGFMCAMVAGMVGANATMLGEAALISDYSSYSDGKNIEAQKIALVLDFLTSERQANEKKPKQMDEILNDKSELERIFALASSAIDDAVNAGIKTMKKYRSSEGVSISVVNFSDLGIATAYPLPGRYASKLQHTLEQMNGGKTLTIVYYGSYISMRISGDIKDKVDILKIISNLSSESSGSISGGGHKEAASIKVNGNLKESALSMLLEKLGVAV